jgi:hypothetical protein
MPDVQLFQASWALKCKPSNFLVVCVISTPVDENISQHAEVPWIRAKHQVATKCWFTFLPILPTNEPSSTNGSVTDWMDPWQHPCWIHTALSLRSSVPIYRFSQWKNGKLQMSLEERHSGVNVTGIQAQRVLPSPSDKGMCHRNIGSMILKDRTYKLTSLTDIAVFINFWK